MSGNELQQLIQDFLKLTSWDAAEMVDCYEGEKELSADWEKDRDELHQRAKQLLPSSQNEKAKDWYDWDVLHGFSTD